MNEDGACMKIFIDWSNVAKKLIDILTTVLCSYARDHEPTACRGSPGSGTLAGINGR